MHFSAAQFVSGIFLPDGGLHQRGASEKQAAAIGHQNVVAHHRQISAAGHAHPQDGRDLRNAEGRHDGVEQSDYETMLDRADLKVDDRVVCEAGDVIPSDGDVIETAASCKEIYEKDGKGFYVFETRSTNQDGEQVVKGTWTNIVRGV